MSRYTHVLLLFVIYFSVIFALKPTGPLPVSPSSVSEASESTYIFSFETERALTREPMFTIQFPSQFNASEQSDIAVFISKDKQDWAKVQWELISSNPYIFKIPMVEISIAKYQIAFSEIMNPTNVNSTANFLIQVISGDTVIEESSEFEGVPMTVRPKPLRSLKVELLGSLQVSRSVETVFTIVPASTYPTGCILRFKMPKELTSQSPILEFTKTGQKLNLKALVANEVLESGRLPLTLTEGESLVFKISTHLLPGFSQNISGFRVEIVRTDYPAVMDSLTDRTSFTVVPGNMTTSVSPSTFYVDSEISFNVSIVVGDKRAYPHELRFKFPTNWLIRDTCIIRNGLVPKDDQISCLYDQGTGTWVVKGFIEVNPDVPILIEGKALTPSSIGSINVTVQLYNPATLGLVNQKQFSISLQNSGFKILKAFTRKPQTTINPGEAGNIYLTLDFKTPLPATIGADEGKIMIDIYPKLQTPLHSSTTNLVCLFGGAIKASQCDFSNFAANKSEIIIKTPSNYSCQICSLVIYSQDPYGDDSGIPFWPLGQRYLIQVFANSTQAPNLNFFFSTQISTETQDLADLKITHFVKNLDEWSFLRIETIIPQNFTNTEKNYFIQIQFPITASAWAKGLGFSPLNDVIPYICFLEGNSETSHPDCELRTGNDTINPEIRIYGIPNMNRGSRLSIILPKIKLDVQYAGNQGNIKFSIVESFSGGIGFYVSHYLVYSKEVQLFNLFSQTTELPYIESNSFVIIGSTLPDAITNMSIGIPSALGDSAQAAFVEIPGQLQHTQDLDCSSTGKCIAVGDFINHLIFIRKNSTTAPLTLTIPNGIIQNPAYSGLFDVKVTLFKNKEVSGKIVYRLNYTGPIDTLRFGKHASENVLFIGGAHLFYIAFSVNCTIYEGGAIYLNFKGIRQIPKRISYETYFEASENMIAVDELKGIICNPVSETEVIISGFKKINPGPLTMVMKFFIDTTEIQIKAKTCLDLNCTKVIQESIWNNFTQLTTERYMLDTFYLQETFDTDIISGIKGPFRFTIIPNASNVTRIIATLAPGMTPVGNSYNCTINSITVNCSVNFTGGQYQIIYGSSFALFEESIFIFDTNVVDNTSGIYFNVPAGQNYIRFDLYNGQNELVEGIGKFMLVRPRFLTEFSGIPLQVSKDFKRNVWTFNFMAPSLIKSFDDPSQRHRLMLQFDLKSGFYYDELHLNKKLGSEFPCIFTNITAVNGKTLKCVLTAPNQNNGTVFIEIINFNDIPLNTSVTVRIGDIQNYFRNSQRCRAQVTLWVYSWDSNNKTFVDQFYKQFAPVIVPNLFPFAESTQSYLPPLFIENAFIGDLNVVLPLSITVPAGGLSTGDVILIELPNEFSGLPTSAISCPNNNFVNCLSYGIANFLTYELASHANAGSTLSIPVSGLAMFTEVPNHELDIVTNIIQEQETKFRIHHIYTQSQLNSHAGRIWGMKFYGLGAENDPEYGLPNNAKEIYSVLEFKWGRGNPKRGSIVVNVRGVGKVYPGCTSLTWSSTNPSNLRNHLGGSAIDCRKDSADTLIITNHAGLQTNQTVKILMKINTLNTDITLNVTSTTFASNYLLNLGMLTVSLGNQNELKADMSGTYLQSKLLRTGFQGDLVLSFTPTLNHPIDSKIVISMPTTSLRGEVSGFNITGRRLSCIIESAGTTLGCVVNITGNNLEITLKSVLQSVSTKLTITTFNDELQSNSGIGFPVIPGFYHIGFQIVNSNNVTRDRNFNLFECFPVSVPTFSVKGLIPLKENRNLLKIKIVPQIDLNTTHYFKFDIHTKNLKGDDLGAEGSLGKSIQILSLSGPMSSCITFKGSSIHGVAFTFSCSLRTAIPANTIIEFIAELNNTDKGDKINYFANIPIGAHLKDSSHRTLFYDFLEEGYQLTSRFNQKSAIQPILLDNIVGGMPTKVRLRTDCSFNLASGDYYIIHIGYKISQTSPLNCTPNCNAYFTPMDNILYVKTNAVLVNTTEIVVDGFTNTRSFDPVFPSPRHCVKLSNNKYEKINDFETYPPFIITGNEFQLFVDPDTLDLDSATDYKITMQGDFSPVWRLALVFPPSIRLNSTLCSQTEESELQLTSCFIVPSRNTIYIFFPPGSPSVSRRAIIKTRERAILHPKDPVLGDFKFYVYDRTNVVDDLNINIPRVIFKKEDYTFDLHTTAFANPPRFYEIYDLFYHDNGIQVSTNDVNGQAYLRANFHIGNSLPINEPVIIELKFSRLSIRNPDPTILGNIQNGIPVCWSNGLPLDCSLSSNGDLITMTLRGIQEIPANQNFEFTIGFSNANRNFLDGFLLSNSSLAVVGAEVLFRNNTLLYSVVAESEIVKPRILPVFQPVSILSRIKATLNSIVFAVNADGIVRDGQKIKLIVEFDAGKLDDLLFDLELGSYADGSKIPCGTNANLILTTSKITCVFVKGVRNDKYTKNPKVFISGIKVNVSSQDFEFTIAGFKNPLEAGKSLNFKLHLYSETNQQMNFVGFQEYNGISLKTGNGTVTSLPNTNPNTFIDPVGQFYKTDVLYRFAIGINLMQGDAILMEFSDPVETQCFFKNNSMVGTVNGVVKAFRHVIVPIHRAGTNYQATEFFCYKKSNGIRTYAFSSTGDAEIADRGWITDNDFLENRNTIQVLDYREVQVIGTLSSTLPNRNNNDVLITFNFGAQFNSRFAGLEPYKYGTVAKIFFDPISNPFTNILDCQAFTGFNSSLMNVIPVCTAFPNYIEIRGWDKFIRRTDTQVTVNIGLKVKNAATFSNAFAQKLIRFSLFYNDLANNQSSYFMNFEIPMESTSFPDLINPIPPVEHNKFKLATTQFTPSIYEFRFSHEYTLPTVTVNTLELRFTLDHLFVNLMPTTAVLKIQGGLCPGNNLMPCTTFARTNEFVTFQCFSTCSFTLTNLYVIEFAGNFTIGSLQWPELNYHMVNVYFKINSSPFIHQSNEFFTSNTNSEIASAVQGKLAAKVSEEINLLDLKFVGLFTEISEYNPLVLEFVDWDPLPKDSLYEVSSKIGCTCTENVACIKYKANSVNSLSPFTYTTVVVTPGRTVPVNSNFNCTLPAITPNANAVKIKAHIFTSFKPVKINANFFGMANSNININGIVATNPTNIVSWTLEVRVQRIEMSIVSSSGPFNVGDLLVANLGNSFINLRSAIDTLCDGNADCGVLSSDNTDYFYYSVQNSNSTILIRGTGIKAILRATVDNDIKFSVFRANDLWAKGTAFTINSGVIPLVGTLAPQFNKAITYGVDLFKIDIQLERYQIYFAEGGKIVLTLNNYLHFGGNTLLAAAAEISTANSEDSFRFPMEATIENGNKITIQRRGWNNMKDSDIISVYIYGSMASPANQTYDIAVFQFNRAAGAEVRRVANQLKFDTLPIFTDISFFPF